MADVKFGYFGDSGEGSDVAVGEAVAGGSKIVATGTPEEVSKVKIVYGTGPQTPLR